MLKLIYNELTLRSVKQGIVQTLFFCFFFFCIHAQNYSIVGTGTTSNTSLNFPAPLGNYNFGSKYQFYITAAQLSSSGIISNASITSIGFNITALNGSVGALANFSIKIYSTNNANPIGSAYVTSTLVAQSASQTLNISNLGWVMVDLQSSFVWNGSSNLVVQTCYNNASSSNNVSTEWTDSGLGSATWSRYYSSNFSNNCSTNLSSIIMCFF